MDNGQHGQITALGSDAHEYESYIEQPTAVPQHPINIVDAGGGIDGFSIWIAAMIIKMSIVLVFIVTTWVALRTLDWLNGQCFAEWVNNIDDEQKTTYYSVRFAAVVIGSALVFAFGGGL